MRYYTNPRGLYPFQGNLTAYCVLRPNNLAVVDPGLGKTHLALAASSILLEDGTIDHAIFVVEKNKLEEFQEDFARFTSFDINTYYGPKRTLRDSDVTLSTYSTLRDSLVTANPADDRILTLTEAAHWFRGKRLLVVCDEAAIFGGSRTSKVYRAFQEALASWREVADVRVLALTATPMERSPENFYNIVSLMMPGSLGTYTAWEKRYVTAVNRFQKPWRFRDLDAFAEQLSPVLLRKRKTDEDVRSQFPETVEKFVGVTLSPAHMKAYLAFDDFLDELPPTKTMPGFQALSAFVCHPRSIFNSSWETAIEWAESYGVDKIRKLPSAKAERVIHRLVSNAAAEDGGGGSLVFCRSVSALRCLAEDLQGVTDAPEFVEYHGGRSDAQNRDAKAAFKAGEVSIMLASSKAERGVNLPEAHNIVMFDAPVSHASYLQRLSRGSRIGSNIGGQLSVVTFVTNKTIEHAAVSMWNTRNEWNDTLMDSDALDDDNFTTAWERMQAIRAAARQEAMAA